MSSLIAQNATNVVLGIEVVSDGATIVELLPELPPWTWIGLPLSTFAQEPRPAAKWTLVANHV